MTMADPKPKQIDPFSHVVDSSHIEFFGGMELQGLEINGVPLKFMLFITGAAVATSNSTAFTVSNVPTDTIPETGTRDIPCTLVDNGNTLAGIARLVAGALVRRTEAKIGIASMHRRRDERMIGHQDLEELDDGRSVDPLVGGSLEFFAVTHGSPPGPRSGRPRS